MFFSHYQVIIVRLSALELPAESPDARYPRDYVFDTPTDVNTRGNGAYIAAEISGAQFQSLFVVGDGAVTNGAQTTYTNSELPSGGFYTCFLRIFPMTFYDRGFRMRRQEDPLITNRQYDVFSSSDYIPVQQTGSVHCIYSIV